MNSRSASLIKPSLLPWGLWLFCASVFSSCLDKEDSPGYNIILITIDDLGWSDLGCYGSSFYKTPHIDHLAKSGVQFTRAYAAAAVCSPTRAAIMTGKYPARLGITDWIRAGFQGGDSISVSGYDTLDNRPLLTPKNPFHLSLKEKTIAEELKEHGYSTAHIGKWHLGTESYFPEKQGFDVNIGGCDFGQPPSYFDPYIYYPSTSNRDTLLGFPTMKSERTGEYLTDREAREASDFIRANRNKPFFLNLNHYAVHTPIQAKESLTTLYRGVPDPQGSPDYAAMVHSVDEAVGTIMTTLEQLGLERRTVIVFTSDNGGLKGHRFTDNSPLRSGKGYPYEGGIRIPLIVFHPQIQGGRTETTPVVSMDLFPTIKDFAGIASDDPFNTDGKNLAGLLRDGSPLNRQNIIWHFPHYRGQDLGPYSILRHEEWKLIRYYGIQPKLELYNLAQDLSEVNDLAPELTDYAARLDGTLSRMLRNMNAKMPMTNPSYKPDNYEN